MSTDLPDEAVDFLQTDALLSDEELETRDTVRDFVERRVLPDIEEWYERQQFPRELIPEFAKLGLLGMNLEGYGCPGRSAVEYGLACMELEAGDSAIRSFISVQGSLSMFAIWRFGSEEQKNQWLPQMANGDAVGCFALTEPGAGSNPAELTTTARRDGDDWVLEGVKRWTTNATIADVSVVWARVDDAVHGFLVPTATDGVSAHPIKNKHSMRASVSAELHLEGCHVPGDALLPGADHLRAALACLNEARYGILWGAVGAARTCYLSALRRSRSREQFGQPIGGFQLTQAKLVEMLVELEKGKLLALHLGRLKDQGRLSHRQVSLGKLNNVRQALNIARSARTILAAEGITANFPVIRHANNLETVITYEGTEEIHQLVLGQAITGLSAFS